MNYIISGKVIRGDGYGRKLGFPTVNLDIGKAKLPQTGVYAGTAVLDNVTYRAGILINPTGKVEAHLLGYSGDAYGREVTLQINKFLREYKKFETQEELIEQIGKDLEKC
ncbi:MAG TPA: riboflavin kinase [Candidatus Paceibacterota bacterium]|jgi:riboflavin kinase/FMN adenylyltransferase|nr:riboflavin kinase [Candidatus Paceibacterota bacterium]